MTTAKKKSAAALNATLIVETLFLAWKDLESYRTKLIKSEEKFTPQQWEELNLDINVARDAYYIAFDNAISTQDESVTALINQIDQARSLLASQVKAQKTLIKALTAVDRIASLAGKLLALGTN